MDVQRAAVVPLRWTLETVVFSTCSSSHTPLRQAWPKAVVPLLNPTMPSVPGYLTCKLTVNDRHVVGRRGVRMEWPAVSHKPIPKAVYHNAQQQREWMMQAYTEQRAAETAMAIIDE
jgi:hypothetical protein